jgi:hypothetical protein
MDQEDLERTLKAQKRWLDGDDGGVRSEIISADFSGAEVWRTNLCGCVITSEALYRIMGYRSE